MPDALAQFLDDISLHIEREIANVPPTVAEALLRGDSGLTTVDVLRILAQPDKAANLLGSAAPFDVTAPRAGHNSGAEAFVA
jgi:hypothetical protein